MFPPRLAFSTKGAQVLRQRQATAEVSSEGRGEKVGGYGQVTRQKARCKHVAESDTRCTTGQRFHNPKAI